MPFTPKATHLIDSMKYFGLFAVWLFIGTLLGAIGAVYSKMILAMFLGWFLAAVGLSFQSIVLLTSSALFWWRAAVLIALIATTAVCLVFSFPGLFVGLILFSLYLLAALLACFWSDRRAFSKR